ncbi:DNA repair protein rad2 [Podila epicladia]|nr:DNA repair protein rad2 [Podila epicladia]KAG0097891.1 DNA repair protein rad2 [Podila epicladia]
MGVKGLWELLHPVARPIKLEALANKRLAIDASIWLHQFMRGMRDNDGAMVSNAHIIGFFRRICKLLYYNIKPVFVFDGGTPILKRLTIQERRRRKRNDANLVKRTAEKLLAAQLRLRALEQKKTARKKKEQEKLDKDRNVMHDSTEGAHYLEELTGDFLAVTNKASDPSKIPSTTTTTGSQAKRIKDQYVLPPMENDFETLSRIRQHDERFGLGEHDDIQTFLDAFKKEEGLDNIDSEVFQALPSEVQYEILSDIRLRSRVTSYERVQEMVRKSETAMDFSKLQVEGVIRRNNVTHKLLNVNQAISKIEEATVARPGRIASQRNRQYILVKNEDGGWALGGKKSTVGTTKEQPVRLDSDDESPKAEEEDTVKVEDSDGWESEDDEEFEEVKIKSSPRRLLVSSPAGKQPLREPLRTIAPKFLQNTKQETSLLDHIEAYVDEDESVEKVMAKFADLEDEARINQKRGYSPTDDSKSDRRPMATGKPIQLGEDPDWPEVLSDDQELGSFDTLQAEDAFTDVDMFVEDETGEIAQKPNSRRALTFAEESALNQEAFHSYWTGYTPDSFKFKNPDHEFLIQEAIDFWDEDRLESELHSACRKLDKANTNDTISVESLQFWKSFLEAVLRRREMVQQDQSVSQETKTGEKTRPSRSILLDDEEDSDDDNDDEERMLSDDDMVMVGTPAALDPRLIVATSTPEPRMVEDAIPASETVDIGVIDFESSFLKKRVVNTATQVIEAPEDDSTVDGTMDTSEDKIDAESPTTTPGLVSESVDVEDKTGDEANLLGLEATDTELALEDHVVDDIAGEEDEDDQDEARDVDLENEEQDFTNLFPEMAVLPGALVMSETPARPVLTAEEQAAKDQKDTATMAEESQKLEGEIKVLKDQHRKHQRDADDLTETMVAETQVLLRLFGIPYIVAPMEAEAQCADLQIRGVVEGILTEDSDVFLFGGLRVFKNMFKEERFVECYLMSDIERDLGVNRDRLVALAYLLGSDYTSGIKGIGLVTAMEILRMFPNLEKFAKWWRGEQVKLESETPAESEEKTSWMEELEMEANDEIALEKLAKACKKVHLPTTFPDPIVAEAYKSPLVDDDEALFQWGIPDLDGLRDFLRGSLGWGQGEVDNVLLPIIRQMSRESAQIQMTLDGFFDSSAGTRAFQPPMRPNLHKSARLRKVVSRLTGQATEVDAKGEKKKKTMKRKAGAAKVKELNSGGEDDSKNENGVLTINSSSDEKDENNVEDVTTQTKKRRTRPTPQTKVPEAVTAAKNHLKSKDVVSKLAVWNKARVEAKAAAHIDSDIAPNSVNATINPNRKQGTSESSGSGSSSEDEDFQSSHWDLLSQRQDKATPRPSPIKKNDAYAKARYGTSLRSSPSPKSRKKANSNS